LVRGRPGKKRLEQGGNRKKRAALTLSRAPESNAKVKERQVDLGHQAARGWCIGKRAEGPKFKAHGGLVTFSSGSGKEEGHLLGRGLNHP